MVKHISLNARKRNNDEFDEAIYDRKFYNTMDEAREAAKSLQYASGDAGVRYIAMTKTSVLLEHEDGTVTDRQDHWLWKRSTGWQRPAKAVTFRRYTPFANNEAPSQPEVSNGPAKDATAKF